MKKVVAIVVGILVLGVAVVLGIAATKPNDTHIERSQIVKASPETILSNVNDFKKWAAWSPWEKVDPNMKRTYSGAESGKGAKYAWSGNDNVGEGDMEILSTEPTKTVFNFHQAKPFEGTSTVVFSAIPEGDATKVTWAMDSKDNPFMCKVMQVFISMDDCCGKEFEKGLASLKTVSESSSATAQDAKDTKEAPATAQKESGDNG
ncbi:MAG: polyketide cyclase [Cyanobacteria bacterium PR.3.49]|nr:polyketide cyclase [Cyanobacteria bacterium PR.3.49]